MTRPGKSPRGQAMSGLFAADPEGAVLHVLQKADSALTAGEVKAALQTGGVAKADTDRAWPAVQRKIRSNNQVSVEGSRYRWTPHEVSPLEALDRLTTGRPTAAIKATLAAIVRTALANPPADRETAARQRQKEIDGVRALAELASEVEELTANEVDAVVMVRSVRAWVKRSGLEPIERAGEETSFDRKRHKPIGPSIRDGAPVVVVRPGYTWKAPSEDVLINKAVVEE